MFHCIVITCYLSAVLTMLKKGILSIYLGKSGFHPEGCTYYFNLDHSIDNNVM